jgi:hypothetical protein
MASADGEILFHAACPKCKEKVSWHVFATALAYHALVEDLQDEAVKQVVHALKPRTAVKPPLALPPPSTTLSEQDRIELHGMGISNDLPS